jgi:hypothetical protein
MLLKSKLKGMLILASFIFLFINISFAHCDSYDGPVIKDAKKALETNNANLLFKWVTVEQEEEITILFKKTYELRSGNKEINEIVEKHFFETLVRLHRENEGAPYTGLKPAGTTKQIIQMTDKALKENNIDEFLLKLNNHINKVVREKYQKVSELNKVKDVSVDKGREFVAAYVDYTHTVEAFHDIIEHGGGPHAGH